MWRYGTRSATLSAGTDLRTHLDVRNGLTTSRPEKKCYSLFGTRRGLCAHGLGASFQAAGRSDSR
jgi:hypothetical protein